MIERRLLNDFLKSLGCVQYGLRTRDKFAILANRVLHATYPLNALWYDSFGRTLLEPRKLIRGYKCSYQNAVFSLPGGNSEIQFLDDWEPDVKNIVANMTEGDAVDVGANFGLYTVLMSRFAGPKRKIVSIEPNPDYFRWLETNLEANACSNVTPLNLAAWSRSATLNLSRHVFGGSLLDSSVTARTFDALQVQARTLDDILRDLKIKPRLIKIDVEGAEADVLIGAHETIRSSNPVILFEALNDMSYEKCRSMLNQLDYAIKPLRHSNFMATYERI